MLLKAGCDLYEPGNISFIPESQKYVASNVVGTAARENHTEIINFAMSKTNDKRMLEFKAIETGGDPYKPIQSAYTPLQLAFCRNDLSLATIKALCEHGANIRVLDYNGHGLLALAVYAAEREGKHEILDYFIKSCKFDLNARDSYGRTPLDFCKE